MKCSHCGKEAVIQFANGSWCCEDNAQKCPAVKKIKSDRMIAFHFHSAKQTLERQIKLGVFKCVYCGSVAVIKTNSGVFCCSKEARSCPEYSNYLSQIKKMNYDENPEMRATMSKAMLEAQNRPDVQEKKSQSMIHLHNDDCEPCREFQKNYKEAHKKRRTADYDKNKRYLNRVGGLK